MGKGSAAARTAFPGPDSPQWLSPWRRRAAAALSEGPLGLHAFPGSLPPPLGSSGSCGGGWRRSRRPGSGRHSQSNRSAPYRGVDDAELPHLLADFLTPPSLRWRYLQRFMGRSRPSWGFSLPFVLIAAAILLTGGLMLALHSSDGLLSILLQRESSDARDAAETGITRIVGELNRPRNRGLLAKDEATQDPDGYLWTSSDAAASRNPCLPRQLPDVNPDDDPNAPDLTTNPSIGFRTTAAGSSVPLTYNTVLLNEAGELVSDPAAAVQSYRLVSVRRMPLRSGADGGGIGPAPWPHHQQRAAGGGAAARAQVLRCLLRRRPWRQQLCAGQPGQQHLHL